MTSLSAHTVIKMIKKLLHHLITTPKIPGKGSFFASLAVSIILLYVVNNLRYMGITQINEANLISSLWSFNIIFGLAIIGNFMLILYRPAWFFFLIQTLIDAAGVNTFYFLYRLYPFNLENTAMDSVIKIILVVIMIGFFAAFLLEFYHLGINIRFPKKRAILIPGSPGAVAAAEVGLDAIQHPAPHLSQAEPPSSAGHQPATEKVEDPQSPSEPPLPSQN